MTNVYVVRKDGEDVEIESKYLVIDEADFQVIETVSQLGNYSLSEAIVQPVEDTFFDTQKKL